MINSVDEVKALPMARGVECYAKLPSLGGVYFLLDEVRVLYIGMASNLKARWACHNHRQLTETENYYIAWALENDSEKRRQSEKRLIERFKPILNKQGVQFSDKQGIAARVPPQLKVIILSLANKERRSESQIIQLLLEESPRVKAQLKPVSR